MKYVERVKIANHRAGRGMITTTDQNVRRRPEYGQAYCLVLQHRYALTVGHDDGADSKGRLCTGRHF
jgi:hypothetical protein